MGKRKKALSNLSAFFILCIVRQKKVNINILGKRLRFYFKLGEEDFCEKKVFYRRGSFAGLCRAAG